MLESVVLRRGILGEQKANCQAVCFETQNRGFNSHPWRCERRSAAWSGGGRFPVCRFAAKMHTMIAAVRAVWEEKLIPFDGVGVYSIGPPLPTGVFKQLELSGPNYEAD